VIVATGMKEIEPVGQYEYGSDPRVVTQLQFEGLLKSNTVEKMKDVVIINCINSKNETGAAVILGASYP